MRDRRTIAIFLILLFIGAARAEPVKIRAGWIVVPSSIEPIMLAKPGLARHEGKSYALEAIHFAGTPLALTALASGEIDVAPLGFGAVGTAIQNAGLDDLRIIADEVEDGVGGYYTNEFKVLNDGPIKKIEDLKGKVVASAAISTAMDVGMRIVLRRHGLEDKRDYTVVEIGFPNMRAVLADHKADLIAAVPPFAFDPGLTGIAHDLFTLKDAFGTAQLVVIASRAGFIAKNRAAMVDFMEDVVRAIRWYGDPANHHETVAIVASFLKQPPERIDWAFTKKDNYRDPNGKPNLDALQKNLDVQKELGFLKADIDVKKYADLSLVEEAAKRP